MHARGWAPVVCGVSYLDMMNLLEQAQGLFAAEPNLLHLKGNAKLFGDIHGQLHDLRRLFKGFGSPENVTSSGDIDTTIYVFIGDFVDRGALSLEVVSLLMAFKIAYPKRVFLLRGNHEDEEVNVEHGFHYECIHRFGDQRRGAEVFSRFVTLFNHLPIAAVLNERILCVHGGIGHMQYLKEIEDIPRPCRVTLLLAIDSSLFFLRSCIVCLTCGGFFSVLSMKWLAVGCLFVCHSFCVALSLCCV